MDINPATLRGLGFVIGGAFFWLMYFDLKDHLRPEPRRLLVLAWIVGCGSAGLCYVLYLGAAAVGLPAGPGVTLLSIFLYFVFLVGPLEEGTKFLAARTSVYRWQAFDEPVDGLVYASAVAIGFASVENVLYLPHLPFMEQVARAVASPLTHSLFASVWGFGVAHALFTARTRGGAFAWQAGTLALSMLLHGLYDYFIIAHNAAYIASLIALLLWLFLIRHARALLHRR